MRGLALAGAGMSTHGVIEQGIWASDMGDEIDVRKDIQQKAEVDIEEVELGTVAVDDGVLAADEIIEDLEGKNPTEELPVVPPLTEPEGDGEGDNKDGDDKKRAT